MEHSNAFINVRIGYGNDQLNSITPIKPAVRTLISKSTADMRSIYNGKLEKKDIVKLLDDMTRDNYSKCTVQNLCAKTEFYYYQSSRTLYEDIVVRNGLKDIIIDGKDVKELKVDRIVNYGKYFCTDTAFPLFKNLFYLLPGTFVYKPSNQRPKLHIEVNLYYELPKIMYYIYGVRYNDSEFKKQYSKLEYYTMIDLFTALVMSVITDDEIKILINLLNKDPILHRLYSNVSHQYTKFMESGMTDFMVSINLLGSHSYSYIKDSPINEITIMREIIIMLLHRFLANMMPEITKQQQSGKSSGKISGSITLKAINDFRLIIGVDPAIKDQTIFRIILPEKDGCDNIIIPRAFIGDDAFKIIKDINKDTFE